MRHTSTTSGSRGVARPARWLVPFLAVAALVVAGPASTFGAHAASDARHDATAHHTRRFTIVGANAVVSDRTEHRDVPTEQVGGVPSTDAQSPPPSR